MPTTIRSARFRLCRRDDALTGFAGPQQEGRVDAAHSRTLDDAQQGALATRALLVNAKLAGIGRDGASTGVARVDDVDDEQPCADRRDEVDGLRGGDI